MKATVLGGGSWGTALADLLGRRGYEVALWLRDAEVARAVTETHENPHYLAGHRLSERVRGELDFGAAVSGAELVIIAVPTPAVRPVLAAHGERLPPGVPLIAASKGIENDSLMTVAEVLEDVLPERYHPYLAFLSGPSFAREVVERHPTAVTVAAWWPKVAHQVQEAVAGDTFRCYTSNDVLGIELGGALKNVIAIGAGIVDGLGFGHNTRAALITRGLAEISRLGVAKGANPLTFMGLAGMGDLLLTCTGHLSRNRTVGVELGKGRKLPQILTDLGMVAEGVKTARSVHDLAERLGVDMPISEQVYQVLYEEKGPREAVVDLMTRSLKPEIYT